MVQQQDQQFALELGMGDGGCCGTGGRGAEAAGVQLGQEVEGVE